MNQTRRALIWSTAGVVLVTAFFLSGCGTKVGSKEWCSAMEKKPQGEWSMDDAKAYAQHCIGQ